MRPPGPRAASSEPSRPQSAAETAVRNVTAAQASMARDRTARVFIGMTLSDEIALKLSGIARELEGPSVRLVATTDLHLTLVAPWDEASPSAAIARMRQAVTGYAAITLTIQHVGYGPDPKRPRFLWADCDPTAELAALRAVLLTAFGQTDDRPFRPHVTLARIRHNGRTVARKHPMDRPVSLTWLVESVELLQSPRAGESGYRVLASGRLGEPPLSGGLTAPVGYNNLL